MKRWKKEKALGLIKRSAISILVCIIVALPLGLTAFQIGKAVLGDGRKASALPAFNARTVDKTAPQLFKEPVISVTFDDGWESVYPTAMPTLQKQGIRTTQYVLSGTEKDPGYMSWDQIKAIKKAGHEIACHSVTHPDLTTLDEPDLRAQLDGCQTEVSKRIGAPVTGFASPYGSYNAKTIAAIKRDYGSQRNINGIIADGISDTDVNLPANFDRYNIIGVTIRRETTIQQLQQLVNYAAARNAWLVLTYHQADDGASQYGIDQKALDKQLEYLSSTPWKIAPVGEVLGSYKGVGR